MVSEAAILRLPSIRDLFEGAVEPLWREDRGPVRLIVYAPPDVSGPDEPSCTLGVLDLSRDLYFEVTFRGEAIVNCRKYTPDNYSHGAPVQRFRELYLDLLTERLPAHLKRRLFGLFLPGDQGVDRHVGGFFLPSVDGEGRWRERSIEVENRYL